MNNLISDKVLAGLNDAVGQVSSSVSSAISRIQDTINATNLLNQARALGEGNETSMLQNASFFEEFLLNHEMTKFWPVAFLDNLFVFKKSEVEL